MEVNIDANRQMQQTLEVAADSKRSYNPRLLRRNWLLIDRDI
jgi:hypothetical protein